MGVEGRDLCLESVDLVLNLSDGGADGVGLGGVDLDGCVEPSDEAGQEEVFDVAVGGFGSDAVDNFSNRNRVSCSNVGVELGSISVSSRTGNNRNTV